MRALNTKFRTIISITALLFSQTSQAQQSFENKQELQDDALSYIEKQISVSSEHEILMRPISSRLKLIKCSIPVIFFSPHNRAITPGRNTLGAKCEGESPWTIYLSFELKMFDVLVVAKRVLARDEKIKADMVELRMIEVPDSRYRVYRDVARVIGLQVSRKIDQGAILQSNLIEEPILIKKGQRVNINYMSDQVSISMTGIAQEEGSLNQIIRVKNENSDLEVEAIVLNPHTVRVR